MDISSFPSTEEDAISSSLLKHVGTLSGLRWTPDQICFSPDRYLLASFTSINTFDRINRISLWDVSQCTWLRDIPTQKVHHIAFSPDGCYLAALWVNKLVRKPKHRPKLVNHIHRVIRLYDAQSLTPLADIPVGQTWEALWGKRVLEGVFLAFSPDSSLLAVANDYGHLLIWNVNEQRLVASIAAHPDHGKY